MRRIHLVLLSVVMLGCVLWAASPVDAEPQPISAVHDPLTVVTVKPQYLPPAEIARFLGLSPQRGQSTFEWRHRDERHTVEIRHNDAANVMILSGAESDVDHVVNLIREADIPPRQIEIEAMIVEVRSSVAKDLGFDWERLLNTSSARLIWSHQTNDEERSDEQESWQRDESRSGFDDSQDPNSRWNERRTERHNESEIDRDQSMIDMTARLDLARVLSILDESGAATIRNAPRILTLNNRRATILDGSRVTYVTRYSSYTNLFETDSMDAGLTLSVLPSLGESGFITLHINAELTRLGRSIAESPIKSGQMLENTIIVRDGESVLLGGLTRLSESKTRRRLPVLGHILPFLFSHEVTQTEEIKSYIILTPVVVDFATAFDAGVISEPTEP